MSEPTSLPFTQPDPLTPPPELRRLQSRGTVHPIRTAVGDPAWLVTGYAEVRALLDDDRLGRSHREPERASRTGRSALFGGPMGDFDTEWADHRRMRSLLQPHFSPRTMKALRGRIETLTAGMLDALEAAGPPADLHDALALPLPIAVICELLGVPYEDRERFRGWTQAASDVTDAARSEQGLADLFTYGRELVGAIRAGDADGGNGADDEDLGLIARLARTDGVSDDEASMLGMSLLFAGHETTVVAIGNGVMWLLAEPERWKTLAGDPSAIDTAVEEILRMPNMGGSGVPRYARTDLEIAGTQVRAGDLVLLDNGSANHDASVFMDPDTFDIARRGPAHLTFGHGARYCVGAPLARMELSVVLSLLTARFPALRLAAGVGDLRFETRTLTGGLTALPVTW